MEEETRRILRDAVTTPRSLGEFAMELFGPDHGVELTIPESPERAVPTFE